TAIRSKNASTRSSGPLTCRSNGPRSTWLRCAANIVQARKGASSRVAGRILVLMRTSYAGGTIAPTDSSRGDCLLDAISEIRNARGHTIDRTMPYRDKDGRGRRYSQSHRQPTGTDARACDEADGSRDHSDDRRRPARDRTSREAIGAARLAG